MVDQARLGSSARFLSGHNCREPEHGARIARAHRARRARLGIPEEKVCKGCGRTFTRSEVPRQPLVHWLAREHCSFTCAHGPPVEPRVCARDGCEQIFKPSWNGDPSLRHCSVSCAQQDRFEAGDVAEAFVEHMPGRSRQRWGGRWNATKPPHRVQGGAVDPARSSPLNSVTRSRDSPVAVGVDARSRTNFSSANALFATY